MSSRNRFRNNTNRNKYGQSVKVGENRDAKAGVGMKLIKEIKYLIQKKNIVTNHLDVEQEQEEQNFEVEL